MRREPSMACDFIHRMPRHPTPSHRSRPARWPPSPNRSDFATQWTALLCQTSILWPTKRCSMSRGSTPHFAAIDFAGAWDAIQHELHDWLRTRRFAARPDEADEVFKAAAAEVQKDDWRPCRDEARTKLHAGTANRCLMAAFSRAVRTIEIEKWSQLILGSDQPIFGRDHKPSGPLPLPDIWRARLSAPWNSSDNKLACVLQDVLGDLALSGWAALGGYGLQAEPGQFFLDQLQQRLKWHKTHGTWESALYSATDSEGRPLLKVFEKQAEKEFNDPADAERAYQWAIDYLVKEKFSAPNIRPIHEVSNPGGFLRTAFAHALVDFRRTSWKPDQVQRPRPDVWMRRLLDQDWIDIFKLSVKHANTEAVVTGFLSGEQRIPSEDDQTHTEEPASSGSDVKQGAPRMTETQRRFQERAQQIEADLQTNPVARIRAIAVWCRSYLEQAKQWSPVASDLPLFITDSEGKECERPLPHVERDPLAHLLCEEDRRRLLGNRRQADRAANEADNLENRLRAFVRTILGPHFALTTEEVAILRRIVEPQGPRRGKPPKDTEKLNLLTRLRETAKSAGLDTSIFDSMSVIFPNWNEVEPQEHPGPRTSKAEKPSGNPGPGDTP